MSVCEAVGVAEQRLDSREENSTERLKKAGEARGSSRKLEEARRWVSVFN
jgi:hypothetical protein